MEDDLPQKPEYTDGEVVDVMTTLQTIYALDDAIGNQQQLRRPETFISPLIQLRRIHAEKLQALTAKGVAAEKDSKPRK